MVLAMLTLFYSIESSTKTTFALVGIFLLQGYLIFQFINNVLKARSEKLNEKHSARKRNAAKAAGIEKAKKDRKKESDLPEADQNTISGKPHESKKVK